MLHCVRLLPTDKGDGVVEVSDNEDTSSDLRSAHLEISDSEEVCSPVHATQFLNRENSAPQTAPLSAVLTSVVAPAPPRQESAKIGNRFLQVRSMSSSWSGPSTVCMPVWPTWWPVPFRLPKTLGVAGSPPQANPELQRQHAFIDAASWPVPASRAVCSAGLVLSRCTRGVEISQH